MTEEGQEMERGGYGTRTSSRTERILHNLRGYGSSESPLVNTNQRLLGVAGSHYPTGEVSVALVEEIFQNCVGVTPLEVLVLNDQDALVDLADGMAITEIAMAIHGKHQYRNKGIRVGCIIAGRGKFDLR